MLQHKILPLTALWLLMLVGLLAAFLPENYSLTMPVGLAGASTSQTPTATFKWSLPERFGGKDVHGMPEYHWNKTTGTYAKNYVHPENWRVNFDACASAAGSSTIDSYRLEIGGQLFPKGSGCRFSHEFPVLGVYPVTLVVTAHDGQTASITTDVTVKDILIVSIGDSFASGEGNPDVARHLVKKAQWVDQRCHRSAIAGPALAALKIEQADPHTSVTFISFACSGAELKFGLLEGQKKGSAIVHPQLDSVVQAVNGRPIDALLISIGGNDANFAQLVLKAIQLAHCDRDTKTNKLLKDGLDTLPGRYAEVAEKVHATLTVNKTFITEYPDIVHNKEGEFCDHSPNADLLFGINREEAQWAAEKVVAPLNELVKGAAQRHEWIYVTGIASQFFNHGYCAGDERWVRTFNDSAKLQGNQYGTVHPNAKGHAAYAESLVEAMRQEGIAGSELP